MKTRGFTLLEVLLVVTIIAFLSMIIIPLLTQGISTAKDGRRKSDLNKISKALEEYLTDKDCYPTTLPLCTPGDGLKPYLAKVPCDPQTGADYTYYPEPVSCPTWFWVFANLDRKNDTQSIKLNCQNGCGPTVETTVYEYYNGSTNAPDPEYGTEGEPPPGCQTGYYGCFSGACQAICLYGGIPECSPNYASSDCNNRCSNLANECI